LPALVSGGSAGGGGPPGGIPTSSGVVNGNPVDALMWMWRTVCSVCQKVCASPHDLEQHLKMHLNGTVTSSPSGNNTNNASPAMILQKSD
uniref:C2H2-type domain-containing protein n=1 Tax=Anisakis simplex TaxID=6269 RepID=A0A0M3K7P7_ANISI